MRKKYDGKNPSADYEKIIPEYYGGVSNSVQMPGGNVQQELKKEIIFDSLLTETGKNFPEVKGLKHDELWFEMVAAVIDKYAIRENNCKGQEWETIVNGVVSQEKLSGNVRSFRKVNFSLLAAAVILLSLLSISLFVRIKQSKNDVTITSKIVPKEYSDTVSDLMNHSGNKILNNAERCNVIDLDSGSMAFVDSGALLSDIKIDDKRVSVHVLKGAVSFSVAKKKQRSFIVNAGLADIVVTGTKFRVIRMDNVVTVAVNNGSVNTVYNKGVGKTTLTGGQAAIVLKDTIAVFNNDSITDLPERKLLPNLLENYRDAGDAYESISKRMADSLVDVLFTSGHSFAAEGELIKCFSCILESKGRYGDALTVLRHHSEYASNKPGNVALTKLKSTLLLKTGDTTAAVAFLESAVNDHRNLNSRCDALSKLYKLYIKSHNVVMADTCMHQYIGCTQKKEGLDKVIINHAHLLRNALMIDAALFWYEYLLEYFAESKYRKDAEYWVSDCIVKKSIEKNSALNTKSTSSGR